MRTFLPGLLALAVSTPLEAQDTEWNRYTLEDLGGVHVRMETGDACQAVGIAASDFQAHVSTTLVESDVGVLTMEEMLEHPALPELLVTIDCAPGSDGSDGAMAYFVGLRVQQSAQMLRNTQITLPEAVTWFSTKIGLATPDGAAAAVQAALDEQVQAFATAWTEINATEEGGG